jgi:hypothetical protein
MAALKVTEDIRSNIEVGQVTVLVLLDIFHEFDMVIDGLLLCKDSAELFKWDQDVGRLVSE